MREHLISATDYYQQARKVVLDGLAHQPTKVEGIASLASAIYSQVLLAGREVECLAGIAKELFDDDAAAMRQQQQDVWKKVSRLPSVIDDRVRFVILLGQSVPALTAAIELLEAMEAKRLEHSKVRSSKTDN